MADDIARLGLFIDSSGVVRATKDLRKLQGQSVKNEKENGKLTRSFGGLKTAIATVGVVALTRSLIGQINTYTALSNKLKLVTNGTQNLKDVQDALFNTAQETRGSLEATNDLYFRLAKSTESLGISQSRLVGVTETINKAVAISGTETQAASAALFQMGQGLAANALRGQELNSVLEQIPRVAQAIADGMNVPLGKLRELAAEGKVTSDVVIAAFESQAEIIDSEFNQTSKTITQAFQQIQNTALKTFGTLDDDELIGALDEFRSIISDPDIVSGLQSIASVLVSITGLVVKAAAGWGMIFDAIADFAAEDGPAKKLQELIESTNKSMEGMGEGPAKAATEALLEQYKAQLDAIREADKAKREAEAEGGGDLGGLGSGAAEAAEAAAMAAAEKVRLVAESEAEAQLLADALILQAMMEQEEAKAAIEQEAMDDRLLREALILKAEQDASDARIAIVEAEAAARKSVVNGMFNNLVSLMNSGSKKMFNIGKVAAIASGLLNLRESVMSAYAAGSEIGGPPLGAAYAATAGLAQAANLAKIKSSSFGGGGSGGGGAATAASTTGGAPVTGSLGLEPAPTEEVAAPIKHELVVAVEGESANSDAMRDFIKKFEETLPDMGSDTRIVLA